MHYENTYTKIFKFVKFENFQKKIFDIFLIFAQNIDCGEAVLTSTHNLCFRAKIRKIDIPLIPQFCYIKVGFKGVYITRTCYPDETILRHILMIYGYNFKRL